MTADEIPDHSRSVQAIPREQRHQLLHLPDQLWPLILGHSLLQNIPNVAQSSAIGLFVNVKPLLVPISERGVPGTAQELLLHSISECQVHSTGNFGATLGPLLPQAKQIAKEVKMGLDSHIRLTKMDKDGNKEDRFGMQIANPNLVKQTEPLEKRMDKNPKTPLEEIIKDNYLTRPRIGVAIAARWTPSGKLPVVEHPQADKVIDGRFGGLRLPPLLPYHFGPFCHLRLGHLLPILPLCFGSDGVQRARCF
jgi:hypothetical protein